MDRVRDRMPMSAPDISEEDVRAVAEVVRSGRLALGPQTEEFERLIAEYVGAKHAVAVSSGTTALHLVVRALGIGPGNEVLVPSFTFAASVNVILYERGTPVFVDIEPDTYNLDPEDLARKITPRTKAILAVDVFGHPAEWDAILRIAGKHGLRVIDDACEALGAEYKGKKLGGFGDAATFAFYPNKQMTTGEGGVVVTDDAELASLCRSLRNQGRGEMGSWLEHERLGYNYRMTEMSAALGVSQLARIEALLAKRDRVARMYSERLSGLEFVRPPAPSFSPRSGRGSPDRCWRRWRPGSPWWSPTCGATTTSSNTGRTGFW
ncbi:DegT/DnrJ/EryC1/StrS family aminotransferase [Candidatus Bipolaricaulota bacterium]|nr:DegT/DnrJ/EryC1/StrS family aminotransferase [Candidatus Bipolaricaulota bacterium]